MVRAFRRSPAVFALVVFTLALGIGGTTAVFGVVDGLLINPLPYPDAGRLAEVWTEQMPAGSRTNGLDARAFGLLRDRSEIFSAVEAYQFGVVTVTGRGEPTLVSGPRVSHGLLGMLGVAPRLGRLFDQRDAAQGERVALISERLWTSRFGRADDAVGRRLVVDGEPHTIVGVLPARFAFPERNADVWRPLAPASPGVRGRVQTVVQLRPDVTREAVGARLQALSTRLQDEGILPRDRRLVLEDLLQRRYGRQFATALYVMLGAVSLVLLIACVNVANVLLARATSRQAEFALMGALGATRLRLVGHAMAESLALAALGGLGSLAVARLLLVTILDRLPPQMAMLAAMTTLDWRAIAVATGLSMVTCLAVGVLPALRVARIDVIEGLKGRPAGGTDRASERWQAGLVIGQLALVLVLLTGTGLLLRSFVRLVSVEPGFDPSGLLVFDIQLPNDRYQAPGASLALFEELEQHVEAIPGVAAASFSQGAPPTGGAFRFDIQPEAEGRPVVAAPGLLLPYANVAPDYFATLGIPLLAGRTFAPDDPEEVVIVNDVLARRFWGESSPVGRRFRLDPQRPWLTVVGVARDVKQMGLNDPMGDGMEVYFPYPRTTGARFFAFIVRTRGSQAGVAQQVKERLWTLDPTVPVVAALTMDERLVESVARPRFLVGLSSAFAGMAVLLAGVGVYGTAAYWVARRRHELGVRLALGATRRAILSLVIGRSVRLAAWGCAIGVAVSLMVTTILGSLLFQTSAREPTILIAVIALLVGLVVTAGYLPALRASQVDPAAVFRTE